jgi:hypothetical protein
MGAINIYLSKELTEELSKVENRSALVADLLRDYFNKGKPLTEIKEQKIKQAETLYKEVDKLEVEISEEEKQRLKDKARMDAEYDAEMAEKAKDLEEKKHAIWRESFTKNWDIPAERVDDLLSEYILLNKKQSTTIMEFMQFKLINPKQKKNSES